MAISGGDVCVTLGGCCLRVLPSRFSASPLLKSLVSNASYSRVSSGPSASTSTNNENHVLQNGHGLSPEGPGQAEGAGESTSSGPRGRQQYNGV